jgi:hypothetical protein
MGNSEKIYGSGKVNIKELLKVEGAKCIVKEKNKPNITLMAKAFMNLRKETLK